MATWRIAIVALMLLAAACSDTTEDGPGIASEQSVVSTTEPTATTTDESGPDRDAVVELWEETLDFFGAIDDDRAARASALSGRIPDEAPKLAEVYFVLDEAVELTSNAGYTERPGGQVEIVDCADSSGPSLLGPTTAGFTATAEVADSGDVILSELEVVSGCVQRDIGTAALDQYDRYLESTTEFWADPRVDHPAIGRHQTAAATEAFEIYLGQLEELDLLDDTVVNNEPVKRAIEIVGYVPGEVRLRDCQHGDETFGIFNADGQRTDLFEPPWRVELIIRMVEVDGEWLFDELINRNEGDCELGQTTRRLEPL